MAVLSERYAKFVELLPATILEEISKVSLGSTAGQEEGNFLNQLLSLRVAEMVTNGLRETARVTGVSANQVTSELEHSTVTVKAVLENSSEWLVNALKVSNDTASKNAREIKNQIADLSANLAKASIDLQAASTQSSRLSKQLNWLTVVLAFAAIATAAATTFQAYQTMRQTDFIEKQSHQQASQPPPQPAPTH
jgi:hypothetical protein